MAVIKTWLSQVKEEKAELSDFITSVDPYFTDTGFNAAEFEKAVEEKINSFEQEVKDSLKVEEDAKD